MAVKNYYTARKTKLLKDFDKTAALVRSYLVSRYGPDFSDTLYRDARYEYGSLIPEIPYIEGMRGRMLNAFLLITAQEVALYKAMKKGNKPIEEAWEICHTALKLRMARYSKIKCWLIRSIMFSGSLKRRMRKLAAEGNQYKFGDFEIRYVFDNRGEFDFGVDYLACGNYKFAIDHGAEEFAPFVCMSDIALSDAMGWGLTRTETLADGCKRCDFRFKKGGRTLISSKAPDVQATIAGILDKETSEITDS